MSGDYRASDDPRWQPLTDSAGNVVTITPMQCAAILHALQVYKEVTSIPRRGHNGPVFDVDAAFGVLSFMNAKSCLMGRLLYDGKPPLVDAPPTVMAAPDYSLEVAPPVSSVLPVGQVKPMTAADAARARALRERYKQLEQIGVDWCRRNPNHCPECYCRPGKGDAEDGSDHEKFCSGRPA